MIRFMENCTFPGKFGTADKAKLVLMVHHRLKTNMKWSFTPQALLLRLNIPHSSASILSYQSEEDIERLL